LRGARRFLFPGAFGRLEYRDVGDAMTATMFTTGSEPAKRRLDAWQAMLSETFVTLDCALPTDTPVEGSVTTNEAGPVVLSHVDTVAQTVHRTSRLIRGDGAEVFLVSCQLSGTGLIVQDGREARLGAGDFAIYDSTRPYTLHFERDFDQLVLHMPRDLLRGRLRSCRALTARRFGSGAPSFHAASGFLRGLGADLAALDAGGASKMGQIALDLISQTILETIGPDVAAHRSSAATLRYRALRVIDRLYSDPDLSTPAIARHVGVSARRLQEIFQAGDETPMGCLWERRLQQAAGLMLDRSPSGRSLTDIAYRCGFADSAQFSRRFRARFDMSPSAWR